MGKQEKGTKEKRSKVGFGKMLAWQSSPLSSGINLLMLGYVSIFATDTLGIPAALVGTLLMISKVFDGVTDLIAGYVIDNTNTKLGKGRPYELCLLAAWFCTVLLYSCPASYSATAKAIWLFVMYVLVNSVFQTFLKGNALVYMTRAFPDHEQYVALQTYGSIIPFFGAVVFNVSFPILMGKLAISSKGWQTLVLIYALPMCLFGMMRFLFIKEQNGVDGKESEKLSLHDVGTVLKNNKYVWVIAIMTLSYNFVTNLSSGVGAYYFKYIVGNVSLLSVLAVTQILALPVLFIYPRLIRKYSTKMIMVVSFFMMVAGCLVNFFAGARVPLLMFGSFLIAFGSAPSSAITPLMIVECADYNEWKGMRRMEGTMSSVRGFASKVGAGIGTGCIGALMGAAGYISAENAVQPQSAITMIRMMYGLIPAVLILLVTLTLRAYDLNKNIHQIREENKARKDQA